MAGEKAGGRWKLGKASLVRRLRKVKLFLCDVDGVLTDSDVWVGRGIELKRFNIVDGLGLKFLQGNGIPVGWVSRRFSPATTERGRELKVDFLFQIKGSKVETVEEILRKTGRAWDEICFVGDDLLDLGVLKRVGFAAAPSNAIIEVKKVAHYVTRAAGGHGAVREVVEMILKAQKKWKPMVERHSE
jgi:3-deoxy-D-manno-octulosonate 8-phosphate phosphatase (KDO 8-P phosphatase)